MSPRPLLWRIQILFSEFFILNTKVIWNWSQLFKFASCSCCNTKSFEARKEIFTIFLRYFFRVFRVGFSFLAFWCHSLKEKKQTNTFSRKVICPGKVLWIWKSWHSLCIEKITLRGRLRYLIFDSSADLCLVVSLLPSDCPKSGFTTLLGGK